VQQRGFIKKRKNFMFLFIEAVTKSIKRKWESVPRAKSSRSGGIGGIGVPRMTGAVADDRPGIEELGEKRR